MARKHLKDFDVTVDSSGEIISIVSGKPLKHHKDKYGYQRVYITSLKGSRSGYFVHRLIALAFIPNPENKRCVNHIDGNKSNHSLDNLEGCTHKENSVHARRTGLMDEFLAARTNHERNDMIKHLGANGFTQDSISRVFKLAQPNIWHIINKR
jgi:hypothetical protein